MILGEKIFFLSQTRRRAAHHYIKKKKGLRTLTTPPPPLNEQTITFVTKIHLTSTYTITLYLAIEREGDSLLELQPNPTNVAPHWPTPWL